MEVIAERRVRALELRKQGRSYRGIAQDLGVDVHTAHADVGAELYALRETAVSEATELRALELERLDAMNAGLWPQIRTGNPPAVTAGVRISERRSRLLGLDAPTTSKTEITASRTIVMGPREQEVAEALRSLDLEDLEEYLRRIEEIIDEVLAHARALGPSAPTPSLPAAPSQVIDVNGMSAASAPPDGKISSPASTNDAKAGENASSVRSAPTLSDDEDGSS